jgi:hypothetical protein
MTMYFHAALQLLASSAYLQFKINNRTSKHWFWYCRWHWHFCFNIIIMMVMEHF